MLSNGVAQYLSPNRAYTAKFRDKEWTFSIGRLKHYSEKAQFIHSKFTHPRDVLAELPAELSPAVRDEVTQKLVQACAGVMYVTPLDEEEFDNTLMGRGYAIWRCLRDHHEELGKLPDGATSGAHRVGNTWYSLTPDQGIDAALSWYEQEVDDIAKLVRILTASTEIELLSLDVAEGQDGDGETGDVLRQEKEEAAHA